jgi:hypothetical protein
VGSEKTARVLCFGVCIHHEGAKDTKVHEEKIKEREVKRRIVKNKKI